MNHMLKFFCLALICMQGHAYNLRKEVKRFQSNALIFSGTANLELSQKIAQYLDLPLGKATVDRFNDGEIKIQIKESVRNKHVFIVQPVCTNLEQSVNDNLVELILLIRTMKRASAGEITVVVPYYGYARQDRKVKARVPISAADIAFLLETAGADRVVAVDLHCNQIQGFFQSIPVDNLCASLVCAPYIAHKELSNIVVVSPDAGGVERANQFILDLAKKDVNAELAVISKQRLKAGVVSSMQLIGDVRNADAIIVDDMCDTGGTLVKAAQLLKDNGVRRVFAVITHPVFSGPALTILNNSAIDEMIITDTVPLRAPAPDKITVISVAPLLAKAILHINAGQSVSSLFTELTNKQIS